MTRLSTADFYRSSVTGLLNRQADSGRLQVQLASGKRIQSGADDPTGIAQSQKLRLRLNDVNISQGNIVSARNNLQQQADLYGDVDRVLNRAREAAIGAANGSRSDADLKSFATVIRGSIEELLSLSNSQDDQGKYIFSGLAGNTPAFQLQADKSVIYQGNSGDRRLEIGGGESVSVAASGHEVFQAIRNGNGDFQIEPFASNSGTGVIQVGEVVDRSAWDGGKYRIELGIKSPASEGAIAFNDGGGNDTLSYTYSINGVDIETLVEGDSRSYVQLQTAINQQTATTGVTATVDGGALVLSNTTPGSAITLTEKLSGASDTNDSVIGVFGSALNNNGADQADISLSSRADRWLVSDANDAIVASGEYRDGVTLQFAGVQTRLNGEPEIGDRFELQASEQQDLFSTLEQLASGLEELGYADNRDGTGSSKLRNRLNRSLSEIDQGLQHMAGRITQTGGRLQRLDAAEASNTAQDTRLQTVLSTIEDLDFTQAATDLSQQLVALQAAQQSFLRIQGLNLFDLL